MYINNLLQPPAIYESESSITNLELFIILNLTPFLLSLPAADMGQLLFNFLRKRDISPDLIRAYSVLSVILSSLLFLGDWLNVFTGSYGSYLFRCSITCIL